MLGMGVVVVVVAIGGAMLMLRAFGALSAGFGFIEDCDPCE